MTIRVLKKISGKMRGRNILRSKGCLIPTDWLLSTVGSACIIRNDLRMPISRDVRATQKGIYPYYGPTGILDSISEYRIDGTFALIGEDGDHFLDYVNKSQTLLVTAKFNVNNHAHVIESSDICDAEWFYNYFHHRNIKRNLTRQGAGRYKLNKETLERLPILIPPKKEQIVINAIFRIWDAAIEKTETLIKAKEKWFSWLISRLISGGKHIHGHIRDVTNEVSERNSGRAIDRVLSVTNNRGFVLPEDQFVRRVASSDLSNYKVVTRGQYAYNPSRINVGSIARLDGWDNGVLSPMYVVFKINEKKVNSGFFLHWLSSHEAKARIRRSAQGSVRETVSFTDLGAIPFPLPSLDQQKQIASVLNTVQQEIDLLKKQAEAYRKQNRGLMQKLLTGQWRVNISEEV